MAKIYLKRKENIGKHFDLCQDECYWCIDGYCQAPDETRFDCIVDGIHYHFIQVEKEIKPEVVGF